MRLWMVLVLGSGCEATAIDFMSEPYLAYTIGSSIAKEGCAGDHDGDCLDDAAELELAALAAPILFLDNGERCADRDDFSVRPFFQVRPIGGDGTVERINITYFLNWPLDCGHRTERYHLGDSEHVRFSLESSDLQTWSIYEATYWAHGKPNVIDGATLDDLADAIGSQRASVAVEGDKHGSWFGLDADSDDCAGPEDDHAFGAIDCFPEEGWRSAYQNGEYFTLAMGEGLNIGEPPHEHGGRFLAPAVIAERDRDVIRYRAASQHDLPGSEYWWNAPEGYREFCGWMCPDVERPTEGGCRRTSFPLIDGERKDFDRRLDGDDLADCAQALESKIDTTPMRAVGGGA